MAATCRVTSTVPPPSTAGDEDWMSQGNTAIVGPNGDVLAGPTRPLV